MGIFAKLFKKNSEGTSSKNVEDFVSLTRFYFQSVIAEMCIRDREVSDRFKSRNYMLVSYKMERLGSGDTERYIVTMVIKSKRSNDEGHMLSLMQEWPDVTVEQIE